MAYVTWEQSLSWPPKPEGAQVLEWSASPALTRALISFPTAGLILALWGPDGIPGRDGQTTTRKDTVRMLGVSMDLQGNLPRPRDTILYTDQDPAPAPATPKVALAAVVDLLEAGYGAEARTITDAWRWLGRCAAQNSGIGLHDTTRIGFPINSEMSVWVAGLPNSPIFPVLLSGEGQKKRFRPLLGRAMWSGSLGVRSLLQQPVTVDLQILSAHQALERTRWMMQVFADRGLPLTMA